MDWSWKVAWSDNLDLKRGRRDAGARAHSNTCRPGWGSLLDAAMKV